MMPFRRNITDLRELRPLRASLNAWLTAAGAAESSRDGLVLATHEAVANAIQHAGSGILCSCKRQRMNLGS